MEFQCCQCQVEFNLTDRLPLVLPSCGHSVCLPCVNQYVQSEDSLICTQDDIECTVVRDQRVFPHNQSIITLLRKRESTHRYYTQIVTPDEQNNRNSTKEVSEFSSEKSISQSQSTEKLQKNDICPIHHKKLELVCLEDGQYICVTCALFGTHKHHDYLGYDQYAEQIGLAYTQIKNVFEKVQAQRNNAELFRQYLISNLRQQQSCLKSLIDLQFSDLIREIEDIKQQVINQIDLNYQSVAETQSLKFESEFQILQHEADIWLNQADILKQYLMDNSHIKINIKQDLKDQKTVKNGEAILHTFNQFKENIDYNIEQIHKTQDIQVPIQMIHNYIVKIMGLHKNKSDVIKQDFSSPLESIMEEKDLIKKVDQSDLLLEIDDKQEEPLYSPKEQIKPLQIDTIMKGKRYSGVFSQSQQPTQPTSPQQDLTKSVNFNSNGHQGKLTNRSMTFHNDLLDSSQVLVKQQAKQTSSNHNSNSKTQKKFTNNAKMNDKLSNTLSIIHQNKCEIIDLSSIDFNEQIIQILCDYLKDAHTVRVLKLSKCKFTDDLLFKMILNIADTKITTLHLQSNSLTEKCLDHIITHLRQNGQLPLKVLYLNQNALTAAKAKKRIDELKKMGVQVAL